MPDPRPNPGRPPAREHRAARTAIACASSLALNTLALVTLEASGAFHLAAPRSSLPVALARLSAAEWDANRGLAGALPPPREDDAPRRAIAIPPDTETDPLRGPTPPSLRVPHVAERDQTAERETVSRHAAAVTRLLRVPQEMTRGRAGTGQRGRQKLAIPGMEGLRGGGGGEAVAERGPPSDDVVERADVPFEQAAARANLPPPVETALPLAGGEGGQRVEGRHVPGLPIREYSRPAGGPDLDGLGYEEGEETRLDARRWEPAAFWIDVRDRIQSEWQRRALLLVGQHDPHEDTYFYKPRTVILRLSLDAAGALVAVEILESSRLDFYDALAVATIREQQPFGPPPAAALDRNGAARINVRFTWLPSVRSRSLR